MRLPAIPEEISKLANEVLDAMEKRDAPFLRASTQRLVSAIADAPFADEQSRREIMSIYREVLQKTDGELQSEFFGDSEGWVSA